ncbi:2-C-methyl-D-erythritol 4-phosphate cytidylyltransferase [Pseudomaricurvus alkylphenolicus]|uniref:2-C-methyl-D-erythritol 4-phosphate cytidylyltransferase n=1 Tax=Pseudomaricurvus alkylphenolicus TaxID=1306991 RepID=UPI0014207F2A|nr:2-C-methyl-D-erythritol 4-phosphate cytidylyltransferase [Pseudomaricurvus alkylphenolicus]NIB39798.1 2-C-methyl-D-erythritol 4-phosphate cytidylyltransferase [Pseudomaricurvus alkylphenolicus]
MELSDCWVVIPAAGVGARMGANKPKQYLEINGKTILEHTLERLLKLPDLRGVVLVLGAEDTYWQRLPAVQNPLVKTVEGGNERCDSVLNGLKSLQNEVKPDDWVLVHDAARPCVALDDIQNLRHDIKHHPAGGILGVPVSDTLKRVSDDSSIEATVDRSVLWQAQTPQAFRYGVLSDALSQALQKGLNITDEASAVESAGYKPLMVEGRRDNIKITRPEDLPLAELTLKLQASP